jgi:hypothetical protein
VTGQSKAEVVALSCGVVCLEHGFVSDGVELFPLPKGFETCLLQVILLFWLLIAC